MQQKKMADLTFYKKSDKIQKSVWKASEDQLDTIWNAADANLNPEPTLEQTQKLFEFAKELGDQEAGGGWDPTIYGFDTGAGYYAFFHNTEEELIEIFKKFGLEFKE